MAVPGQPKEFQFIYRHGQFQPKAPVDYRNTQIGAPPEHFDPLKGNLGYYTPAMSNVSNLLGLSYEQLGPYLGGGAPLYTASPYGGRLMDTLGALQGMTGSMRGTGFNAPAQQGGLAFPMMAGLGSEAQLNLTLQEPERINALLQTILGGYKATGAIMGEQQAAKAAAQDIRTGKKRQQAGIYSSVPIVGGILASSGLGG